MERRRFRSRSGWLTSLTLIAAVEAASTPRAQAVDAAYGVNAGYGTTDNITRVATDEVDESMATIGAFLDLNQESARLKTNLSGNFTYLNYLDNTYDDDVVGRFDGDMVAGIVPGLFEWIVDDTFGQSSTQLLEPVTPETRENVNYFSTGPRVTFGKGWLKTQIDARYSDVNYEITDLDSERYSGDLSFIHEISQATSVSLNAHYDQIEYQDEFFTPSFDRTEGFLRYSGAVGRTQLSVDAGFTEVGGDVEEQSGFLGRLLLSRRTSPASALELSLGREISDSAQSFRQLESTDGAAGTQPVQPTGDPFVNRYATLGWSFDRGRTGFGASISYYDELHISTSELDRKRTAFGIHARRDMAPTLQLRLAADYSDQDLEEQSQEYAELYAMAQLKWTVGEHLSLDLQYEHFDGDGKGGGLRDYVENRLWLRMNWRMGSIERDSISVPISTGSYR